MQELLVILIVIAVWFFVQRWLLPRMGVAT